jgi:hypothetical protein
MTAVPAPPTAPIPAAEALDEEAKSPAPEIGGHIEAAYHLDLTHPDTEDPVVGRSFDVRGGNTFMLHAAHLVVKHAFSDAVSGVIEIDAGEDAYQTSGLSTSNSNGPNIFDVQEAYGTYTSDFGLSFTAGKFVTYEGIEVVEGPMNPTITRGFLFGLAEPVNHIGAKVHYSINPDGQREMANIGLGVVNGWDSYIDNNDAKTLIFRVGVTPVDQFWVAASGTFGAERTDSNDDRRLSLDLTGAFIANEMITINFQANYGQEKDIPPPPTASDPDLVDGSWFGFGIQPVIKVDEFSAGLRFEYFMDDGGSRIGNWGTDTSLWNITLTPGYTFDEKLQVRAEFRYDKSNEEIFTGDLDSDGARELESAQQTIAVGVAYMF